MHSTDSLQEDIFNVDAAAFEALALRIFYYQYERNTIYRRFCDTVHKVPDNVTRVPDIPFLPIQFFKTQQVIAGYFEPQVTFESSGTTGSINSKHLVKETALYEQSFLRAFEMFYGNVQNWCVIGLLPSYLERQSSSLVYMVNDLIKKSGHAASGFYLYEHEQLAKVLTENEAKGQPTILIGVTYALLDMAEKFPLHLKHTIVMETGGMKGRREEMTREEVQSFLKKQFDLDHIHSEYGMTELLSQAYSKGNGIFNCPPWMKIVLRAEDDPFEISAGSGLQQKFKSGVVNVIDLANLHSCSFIATDDIGKLYADESFEILGRLDNSDIRGCGLMIV